MGEKKGSENPEILSSNPLINNENHQNTSMSDTSLNEEYSMNFDDENDAQEASVSKNLSNLNITQKINFPKTKGDNIDLPRPPKDCQDKDLLLNQIPINSELEKLLPEDNIVSRIYNKLHLSQESACSTISDRLSTIPEDPRSHEELENKRNFDNPSIKSSSIRTILTETKNLTNEIEPIMCKQQIGDEFCSSHEITFSSTNLHNDRSLTAIKKDNNSIGGSQIAGECSKP